ncbi:MAG: MurR/RpiR family transcriptional regulator [Turicibacter sp.]|nr:MurR/RpiR family transcriptional regulator [Turicibacter sp.]
MSKILDILTQIELVQGDLPVSEKKIAQYILRYSKEAARMSINEVAAGANASSAAVVRFCKSLGLSGFPQLKERLLMQLGTGVPMGYSDIEANEPIETLIEKKLANTLQTFQDTASRLDPEEIEKAARLLGDADLIYLYGMGASLLVAKDIAAKWNRIGKKAVASSERHLLLATMVAQREHAVFFGISYSGETQEVIQLAKQAHQLGMPVIGLSSTGKNGNSLSRVVDVCLLTAKAHEAGMRLGATNSRFAQLFVADLVLSAYASANYEKTIKHLQDTKLHIDQLRKM